MNNIINTNNEALQQIIFPILKEMGLEFTFWDATSWDGSMDECLLQCTCVDPNKPDDWTHVNFLLRMPIDNMLDLEVYELDIKCRHKNALRDD